jgi:glutamate carboxypeptidase
MNGKPSLARVEESIASHANQALLWLRQWVNLNSFTLNTEGVNRLGLSTARAFEELGFIAEYVDSREPAAGRHLSLVKPGSGDRSVVLIGHLDTVFPPEETERLKFGWREEGDRVYGPGVIDMKGGTAIAWLTLRVLAETWPELYHRTGFHYFLNATEEGHHFHFGEVVHERLPKNPVACLVMEPEVITERSEPNAFRAITARKGGARFVLEVAGHGAHAGSSHEKGANAIRQLARLVEAAEALTNDAKKVTVNVGTITGGESPNRVPHHARAEGDLRAFHQAALEETRSALQNLENTPPLRSRDGLRECRVQVRIARVLPPMEETDGARKLVGIWNQAAAQFGRRVEAGSRGGMSDGNLLFADIPTLDGLGAPGANMHCSEHNPAAGKEAEYLDLPSFRPKALLNTLALIELLGD